jgi:predicted nucleic acid-binding protein
MRMGSCQSSWACTKSTPCFSRLDALFEEAVENRLAQMAAYFPDARVTSYEEMISSMTNHPKDRHVLAAAVAGRADMLVTENLKDFAPAAVATSG